jgi:hypothetical protein
MKEHSPSPGFMALEFFGDRMVCDLKENFEVAKFGEWDL